MDIGLYGKYVRQGLVFFGKWSSDVGIFFVDVMVIHPMNEMICMV